MGNKEDLADELEKKLSSKENEYEKQELDLVYEELAIFRQVIMEEPEERRDFIKESFEANKVIMLDYLKENNITAKLKDIVCWARQKGLNKLVHGSIFYETFRKNTIFPETNLEKNWEWNLYHKTLPGIADETFYTYPEESVSDLYHDHFYFYVQEKKYFLFEYTHAIVKAKVLDDKRIVWVAGFGSDKETRPKLVKNEEEMFEKFKNYFVDLVDGKL